MRPTTRLRKLLREPGIIVAPGAYDCLTAKIIYGEGFPAVYLTGGGTSITRQPGLGITTMTEMVTNATNIASITDLLVFADGDPGDGDIHRMQDTIRQLERAGVAAVYIEDQAFPKICGHIDGKRVIGAEEMCLKIRAAVEARSDEDLVIIVRVDALAVTGLDDTVARCEKYAEAGADVLFVEAPRTREEMERLTRHINAPLLYNFSDKGRSPLVPVLELEQMGFKIVVFASSAILTVCKMVTEVMREIKTQGTTQRLLGNMISVDELFETVGAVDMQAVEAGLTASSRPTS